MNRKLVVDAFFEELRKQSDVITEFDERLWLTLVDSVIVYQGWNGNTGLREKPHMLRGSSIWGLF